MNIMNITQGIICVELFFIGLFLIGIGCAIDNLVEAIKARK